MHLERMIILLISSNINYKNEFDLKVIDVCISCYSVMDRKNAEEGGVSYFSKDSFLRMSSKTLEDFVVAVSKSSDGYEIEKYEKDNTYVYIYRGIYICVDDNCEYGVIEISEKVKFDMQAMSAMSCMNE